VVLRDSFGDIEALAGELPMLPLRSYRIGSDQGMVVLVAAVIDRRHRWVVTLDLGSDVDRVPVEPKKIIDLPPLLERKCLLLSTQFQL
jgi:hypothetical protein